jgi:hypothetical protein
MAPMQTTATNYRIIAQDLNRSLTATAKQPAVSRETDYYLKNIGSVKSTSEFLGNDRLYRYAMKAFGLEDMTFAKAFMRKVVEGGAEDRRSFANSLVDQRYREFARVFDFKDNGEPAARLEAASQGVADRYVRQIMETDAGKSDEGVRLALYFQRKAPDVKSAYGLLADPALLKVAQTLAALPPSVSKLDIDRQAEMLNGKLNIGDLADPEKLQKLVTRFVHLWDAKKEQTPGANPLLSLFDARSNKADRGAGLFDSLLGLRLGGR